jgi:ketosteroid isomerase-like protein
MRVSVWSALIATSLLIACAPLQPAPLAGLEDEVSAFLTGYLEAIEARDAARIREAYVADERFAWIEDGKVRYRRVEDVLSSLATFPVDSPIRTELTELSVVSVGPVAAHAWALFKTTVGEGAKAFAFGGAISFVLERDGKRWRIVSGHSSSPSRR